MNKITQMLVIASVIVSTTCGDEVGEYTLLNEFEKYHKSVDTTGGVDSKPCPFATSFGGGSGLRGHNGRIDVLGDIDGKWLDKKAEEEEAAFSRWEHIMSSSNTKVPLPAVEGIAAIKGQSTATKSLRENDEGVQLTHQRILQIKRNKPKRGRNKTTGKRNKRGQKRQKKNGKRNKRNQKKTSKRGKKQGTGGRTQLAKTRSRCFTNTTYDEIDDDIAKLSSFIRNDVVRSHFLGGIVRLAAHDFMDFDRRDKSNPMGSDGCFDPMNPSNSGLPESVWCTDCLLRKLYEAKYRSLSRADFWIASANAVIRQTSRNNALDMKKMFTWGRKDAASCRGSADRLPDATGCKEVETAFLTRMGLEWRDAAALLGAHSLGRGNATFSGHEGTWVDNANDAQVSLSFAISALLTCPTTCVANLIAYQRTGCHRCLTNNTTKS